MGSMPAENRGLSDTSKMIFREVTGLLTTERNQHGEGDRCRDFRAIVVPGVAVPAGVFRVYVVDTHVADDCRRWYLDFSDCLLPEVQVE